MEDDIVEVPADSSVSAKRGSSRKCFNGSGSEDVTLIADDSATAQASTSGRAVALSPLEELHHQVEQMKAIFPDCDPDYLYYTLECRSERSSTVRSFVEFLIKTSRRSNRILIERKNLCVSELLATVRDKLAVGARHLRLFV